jgi:hypothetical protein
MAISRGQQILLKRAQRECALEDSEYRDALQIVSGCRSSTDHAMTDRHVDVALAYFEAIFWRKVDAGQLRPACNPDAVFRQRDYWKKKNTNNETSRDRFTGRNLKQEIADLEGQLQAIGFSDNYCAGIRANATHGRNDTHALYLYRTALDRTLRSKQRQAKQFFG